MKNAILKLENTPLSEIQLRGTHKIETGELGAS